MLYKLCEHRHLAYVH